jgi:hypothetical protein
MNYEPKSLDALASVWGFSTEPGAVSYGRRTVTRRSSGEDLWVTAHLAVGTRPGPILGVLSGSHGDEVYGVDMVRRLLERLRGLDFAGAVMCLPMANALAYETGTRTTGQGLNTDNNNLNRVFPGDRDGALNNQLAAVITESFIAQVSVLLDVHTGGQDTLVDYVCWNGMPVRSEWPPGSSRWPSVRTTSSRATGPPTRGPRRGPPARWVSPRWCPRSAVPRSSTRTTCRVAWTASSR